MKSVYCLIVLLFLSFGNQKSIAQTITFKSSSVSITEKDEKGKWSNWSDFVKAELVITIDAKKDRIVVNSPEIQVFTIKSYGEKIENDTDKIVPFDCIDNNGSKCKILAITRKKEDGRMQFYINYSEVKFVYNLIN
jgi:phosphosulfolactate phosphohydrolase-like enzyme